MEMKMYMGEDEGDDEHLDEHSPGGIVIETLSNIRTVASSTLEEKRCAEYAQALRDNDPHPIRSNMMKGSAAGLGQFVQMWGIALMVRSLRLVNTLPSTTLSNLLFFLKLVLVGRLATLQPPRCLAIAAHGAVNRDKAKLAADRIFTLVDRQSEIDPLSDLGKKNL